MAHYKGAASEAGRAMQLMKKRELAQQEIEFRKKKIEEDLKINNIENKFASHYDAVEQQLKSSTIGLVTLDEMKAKQEDIVREREKKLAQKKEEKDKEKLRALEAKQAEKNKQKQQIQALSFNLDDEDEEDENDDGDGGGDEEMKDVKVEIKKEEADIEISEAAKETKKIESSDHVEGETDDEVDDDDEDDCKMNIKKWADENFIEPVRIISLFFIRLSSTFNILDLHLLLAL